MIVLDEGAWAGYSCSVGVGGKFLEFFSLLLITTLVFLLIVRFKSNLSSGNSTFTNLNYFQGLGFGLKIMFGVWIFAIACFAFGVALKPAMTWLKLDETALVETGCKGFSGYELRIPRANLNVSYHRIEPRRRSHSVGYELVITSDRYRADIWLKSSPYLANIARFAREPMKLYAKDLYRDGYGMPADLMQIWY